MSNLDPFFSLELIVVVIVTDEAADVSVLLWVVAVDIGEVVFEKLVVLGVDLVVVDCTVGILDVVVGFEVVTRTVVVLETGGATVLVPDFVVVVVVVVTVFVLDTGESGVLDSSVLGGSGR